MGRTKDKKKKITSVTLNLLKTHRGYAQIIIHSRAASSILIWGWEFDEDPREYNTWHINYRPADKGPIRKSALHQGRNRERRWKMKSFTAYVFHMMDPMMDACSCGTVGLWDALGVMICIAIGQQLLMSLRVTGRGVFIRSPTGLSRQAPKSFKSCISKLVCFCILMLPSHAMGIIMWLS